MRKIHTPSNGLLNKVTKCYGPDTWGNKVTKCKGPDTRCNKVTKCRGPDTRCNKVTKCNGPDTRCNKVTKCHGPDTMSQFCAQIKEKEAKLSRCQYTMPVISIFLLNFVSINGSVCYFDLH